MGLSTTTPGTKAAWTELPYRPKAVPFVFAADAVVAPCRSKRRDMLRAMRVQKKMVCSKDNALHTQAIALLSPIQQRGQCADLIIPH